MSDPSQPKEDQDNIGELPPEIEKRILELKAAIKEALKGKSETEFLKLAGVLEGRLVTFITNIDKDLEEEKAKKLLQNLKARNELSIDEIRDLLSFFHKVKGIPLAHIGRQLQMKTSTPISSFLDKHAYYRRKGKLIKDLEKWLAEQVI